MVSPDENPYDPPRHVSPSPTTATSRGTTWIQLLFCLHILAVIFGALLARGGPSGTPQVVLMQSLVIYGSMFTLIACPAAIIWIGLTAKEGWRPLWIVFLGGDIALSIFQFWIWAPTFR